MHSIYTEKIKLGVGGGGVAVNTAPGMKLRPLSPGILLDTFAFLPSHVYTTPRVSFLRQPLSPALLRLDVFNQAAIFAVCAKYTLFKCIQLELLRILALPEIEQA